MRRPVLAASAHALISSAVALKPARARVRPAGLAVDGFLAAATLQYLSRFGCLFTRDRMEENVPLAKMMAAAVVAAQMAAAAAFMPLEPGNSWVYRSSRWNQTLTVRVGLTPIVTNGNVYHRLTGYTPQPLWVRADASGDLYYLDEDTQQEVLLTSFQSPVWQAAPKRMCSQDARVLPEPAEYRGPAGRYNSAKMLEYRVNNCADAGVEQELYVENIGMVRRVETTIAGPVAFDLVQAAVGP
jgi:hypothetical protein